MLLRFAVNLIAVFAAGCEQSTPTISVNAANVQRVTVATKDGVLADFDDQGRIRRLASLLNGAKPVGDHKCASCGVLTLHLSTDASLKLELVSGHDDKNFELRQNSGMASVSRKDLLDVLQLSYPFRPDPCTQNSGHELDGSLTTQPTGSITP